MADFQNAIKLSKTDPICRAGAAWLYATSADAQIRNGGVRDCAGDRSGKTHPVER